MKNILRQHPASAYFILTFIISWSGIIFMSFFMGMPTTSGQFEETGPVALVPFLLGPTVVSLLLTGAVYGRTGFRELKSRFLKWNINGTWYCLSVLMMPALLAAILFILSRFSPDFVPKIMTVENRASFIITGALTGLIGGGLLEETGWTGFAAPALRARYGVFKTGLVIGLLWGLWHFLPVFWGSGDVNGNIDWSLFLPGLFSHYAVLVPFRIILVWVHDCTRSMVPVILMHTTLTTFLLFVLNISKGGCPLFVYYLFLSIALWLIVARVLAKKSPD